MITSREMQQNPSVLLRAPILSGKGWRFEAADSTYTQGKADVIDLNGNGVDTYGSGGFLAGSFGYYDPALSLSLEKLRAVARERKTEVLTAPDLAHGQVQVENLGVEQSFCTREIRRNRRSLDQLARQEVPSCPQARWAIDTVKGEFLVFDGASSQAPALPEPASPPARVQETPTPPPAPTPQPTKMSSPPPARPPAPPEAVSTPRRGGGLLLGCGVAMGGMLVASSVPGPAGLAVLAGGFLLGGALAVWA